MVDHIDNGSSRPKGRNNMEMYLRVSGDEPGNNECAAVTRMHMAFGGLKPRERKDESREDMIGGSA